MLWPCSWSMVKKATPLAKPMGGWNEINHCFKLPPVGVLRFDLNCSDTTRILPAFHPAFRCYERPKGPKELGLRAMLFTAIIKIHAPTSVQQLSGTTGEKWTKLYPNMASCKQPHMRSSCVWMNWWIVMNWWTLDSHDFASKDFSSQLRFPTKLNTNEPAPKLPLSIL